MDTHVLEYIPDEDLRIFKNIRLVGDKLPNHDSGNPRLKDYKIKNMLSCHLLAKALEHFFPVRAESGFIYDKWEHSWLITRGGFVIDVYPIALFGGPVIVDASECSPWSRFYNQRFSFKEHKEKKFLEEVEKIKISIAVILHGLHR